MQESVENSVSLQLRSQQPAIFLPTGSTHDPEKTATASDPQVDLAGVASKQTDFGFLPIPPSCRYNPDKPFTFHYWTTAIFALASTFSMLSFLSIFRILFYTSPFAGGKRSHLLIQSFVHLYEKP